MISKKYIPLAFLFLTVLTTGACAVSPDEDANYSYDRVMKAWIHRNYPGVQPQGETGAYILEMDPGSGQSVNDSAYIRAHYVKRKLDQTIISTNILSYSEQLGTYSNTSYYGGNIWRVDQGYLPAGLESVLKTMRAGGHVKVALPLSASKHATGLYNAFSSTAETDNEIIDVTVDTVIANIYDYQEKEMKAWFTEHYGVSDTAALHLYFKKLTEKTAEADTVSEGTSVKVRYVGRLLNGQVFDTNIEDTAKFYRIWKSGGSYSALSVNYYKTDSQKFSSENSVVAGFGKAVTMMNYGETAVTLFNSELAYGESGENPSIPEYAPLTFWLYVEPKE